MKNLLLLFFILNTQTAFAEEELVELEEIEFSEDEFLTEVNNDTQLDSQTLNEDFNLDVDEIPKERTPKLNPDTKIITTRKGKYIYHPNQEKGLYKISRGNEYHYKYKKSPLEGFIHVKGGSLNLENFPTEPASGDTSLFKQLYDSTSITTAYFEYEWQPLKKLRSLSLKAGFGISYARGQGRFVGAGNVNAGLEAQEKYTLMAFPLSFGAIYKFKFMNDQLFLPYATGALDYTTVTEFRSGFDAFRRAGILGAHVGGGVLLNLGWLEKSAALELDKDFGINNAYLSLEGRSVISFNDDFDINGFIFLAGLSFEY